MTPDSLGPTIGQGVRFEDGTFGTITAIQHYACLHDDVCFISGGHWATATVLREPLGWPKLEAVRGNVKRFL